MQRIKIRQGDGKKKKECEDLLELFDILNEAKCELPNFVATDLNNVPCIKAAEADVCVLIVKMERMQDTIEKMRTQMKELANDRKIQKVESDVNNLNKEVSGELYEKALNENKTESSVKTEDTRRFANNSKKLADIVKNWEDKDQWHIVEHKKKPRSVPKFGIRDATPGTGKSLKAAKDKITWHLYVGNLACGTDADQVCEFLTDSNEEVMTCEGVGTGHWENLPEAFHVEVVHDVKDTIMMESFGTKE